MVTTDKARRLSDADRAGYQARSPEGHAARGMSIRGQEDAWIRIQESAKTEGYFFKHFMPFLGGEGVKISCCKRRLSAHTHFVFLQNFVKSSLGRRFPKGLRFCGQLLQKIKINTIAEGGRT